MPPLACYTWHPTDTCKLQQMATPKGILPIHTTDFPLLQCPLLALGSLPSILNAEEKLSLLNPWSMSSCTAFLHSLNKSVIIWLQYNLHITLFPCHFTRWIGNLRTSQEKNTADKRPVLLSWTLILKNLLGQPTGILTLLSFKEALLKCKSDQQKRWRQVH